VKEVFDGKSRQRSFENGDLVLMWDKRNKKLGHHHKFDSLWLGSYQIHSTFCKGSFYVENIDEGRMTFGEILRIEQLMQIQKFNFNLEVSQICFL